MSKVYKSTEKKRKTTSKKSTDQKQGKASSRRQAKLQKRRRRIKLLCRAGLAGVFLGIVLSFGRILLSYGLSIYEASTKPDSIISDYTQEYRDWDNSAKSQVFVSEYAADHNDKEVIIKDSVTTDYTIKDSRQVLDDKETERRLAELALTDPDIAEIYAHKEEYPEDLLMALAANQEVTEFVKGYLTASQTVTGGISPDETAQSFPLFMQWDARWGYVPYGGLNIGISGCGPTCLSMVIFALTRNEKATPDALASYSMDNGYYTEGVGTSWSFMTDAVSKYGVRASEIGLDEAEMKYYLDRGCPIICAMRPGDFTNSGHFIMIYGYDKDGFMVNDPNSRERSDKRWDFETLRYQIKNLWGYSKA